jgi:hypothetical protein
MGRVPKRLKTGDKPNAEAIKVQVKVGSNDNKEEESSDNDANEEEEDEGQEEQVVQSVAPSRMARVCTIETVCTTETK